MPCRARGWASVLAIHQIVIGADSTFISQTRNSMTTWYGFEGL